MRLRPDNKRPEPGVAEKWEISDDGRVYTFHLRDNARWSNGDPVTAHDFLYSIRRLIDPLTASNYSYQAWYIENAKRYNLSGSRRSSRAIRSKLSLTRRPNAVNTVRGKLLLRQTRADRSDEESQKRSRRNRRAATAFIVVDIDGRERRFQPAMKTRSIR